MLTFSVNQKYNEAFRGVYFLRMGEKKKFSQISYLLSFSSSNLKVSIYKKKKKKKTGIIDCPPLHAYHFTI